MPKNPLEDLDEVLIKSQRLNTHFGDAGSTSRYLQRNVSELSEASKQLAEALDSKGGRTFRTLAADDMTAKNLLSHVNSIRLKSKEEAASLETTSLEGYLAHHRDMIVLTAIEESRRQSEEYLEESRRRWNVREWETAKTNFMESLGHRAQTWSKFQGHGRTAQQTQQALAASARNLLSTNSSSSVPPVFQAHREAVQEVNLAAGSRTDPSSGTRPVAACTKLLEKADMLEPEEGFMARGDISGYKLALNMLRYMVGEQDDGESGPSQPGSFAPLCFDTHIVSDDSRQTTLHGTLSNGAKRFLEDKAMEQWTLTLNRASSVGEFEFGPRTPGRTSQARLMNYVQYLQRTGVIPQVSVIGIGRSASSAGGSLAGSFSLSSMSSPKLGGRSLSSGDNVPLWPFVYYCLRAGQVSSALSELQEAMSKNSSNSSYLNTLTAVHSILQVLQSATNAMRSSSSTNASSAGGNLGFGLSRPQLARDMSSAIDTQALKRLIGECREQYRLRVQQAVNASDPQTIDPYIITVLNLVSAADRKALAAVPGSASGNQHLLLPPQYDLLDFFWSQLWFISLDAAIQTQLPAGLFSAELGGTQALRRSLLMDAAAAAASASSNITTKIGEEDLLEFIYTLGSEQYFEQQDLTTSSVAASDHDDISAVFRYVLALFVCHRFGDAIQHLWTKSQVFAAVHLTIACLHYGLILPHQPLLANPLVPLVQHHFANHLASIATMTPLVMIQLYVSHKFFKNELSLVSDYLLTLDVSLRNAAFHITPVLEPAMRDAFRMQAQEKVDDVLENYVMSLHDMDSVILLVGDELFLQTKRLPAKQRGYWTQYLTSEQITQHIQRIANKYRKSRDSKRAVEFLLLAGNLKEVLAEFCGLLSTHWLQVDETYVNQYEGAAASSSSNSSSGLRKYWLDAASNFLNQFGDHVPASAARDPEILEYCNFVQLLLGLHRAVDQLFLQGQPAQALETLDSLQVFPSHLQASQYQQSQSTTLVHRGRFAQHILDDVILFAAKCIMAHYQQLQQSAQTVSLAPVAGAGNNAVGLWSDRASVLTQLHARWQTLLQFVREVRRYLRNPQTEFDITRLDNSFVWRV